MEKRRGTEEHWFPPTWVKERRTNTKYDIKEEKNRSQSTAKRRTLVFLRDLTLGYTKVGLEKIYL